MERGSDIAEAAMRSNSPIWTASSLELLQKADLRIRAVLDRILQIAADAFAEHAGTDESNEHVLEEAGKLDT